ALASPNEYYKSYLDDVKAFESDIKISFERCLQTNHLKLGQLAGRLDALSPLAVLSRGYAVVKNNDNNKLIKSVNQLNSGDRITLALNGGNANCTVNEVKYD
ncbi:MAG: exodeoxyribonuclease VII large subunit, partial [Eubacterium sp.]|nr:exodeoxyribonuclease VII large subunit [Eubacterium sp.]